MVDFGKKLKMLRKENGMTQQELAKRLGISKSLISYYELSERSPSPEILAKIAYFFHTTTDYLLDVKQDRTIDVSGLNDKEIAAITNLIELLKAGKK